MTSRKPGPDTVLIDGVRYVPVSTANPAVPDLENVIISQWAGDNWRDAYPDAPGYLRVIVTDGREEDEGGETVTEFLARLVQSLDRHRIQ
jgi:hypothetical protein